MPRARKSFGPADGARADLSTDGTALETLETFKAQGKGLFKKGKYVQAKAVYSQCLKLGLHQVLGEGMQKPSWC